MAMQSKRAVFTGVESCVDIVWDKPYVDYVCSTSISQDDTLGAPVSFELNTQTSTGIRVEPSDTFTGFIDVLAIEVT